MKLEYLEDRLAWAFTENGKVVTLNGAGEVFPNRQAAVWAAADRYMRVLPDGEIEEMRYA